MEWYKNTDPPEPGLYFILESQTSQDPILAMYSEINGWKNIQNVIIIPPIYWAYVHLPQIKSPYQGMFHRFKRLLRLINFEKDCK